MRRENYASHALLQNSEESQINSLQSASNGLVSVYTLISAVEDIRSY
jgi:hypothetical protein